MHKLLKLKLTIALIALSITLINVFGFANESFASQYNMTPKSELSAENLREYASKTYPIKPMAYTETVLDTYAYVVFYDKSRPDIPVYMPTYKELQFPNSYTRTFPDTLFETHPIEIYFPGANGIVKWYKCNYKVW